MPNQDSAKYGPEDMLSLCNVEVRKGNKELNLRCCSLFCFFFSILFKVSIYELQHIIVVNLLQNAQVLFHVANAMDAISLKDIKGNACEL